MSNDHHVPSPLPPALGDLTLAKSMGVTQHQITHLVTGRSQVQDPPGLWRRRGRAVWTKPVFLLRGRLGSSGADVTTAVTGTAAHSELNSRRAASG